MLLLSEKIPLDCLKSPLSRFVLYEDDPTGLSGHLPLKGEARKTLETADLLSSRIFYTRSLDILTHA